MKRFLVLFLLLTVVAAAPMSASMGIVGVSSEGRGVISNLTVEIQDGKGRVLVTTEPFVGIDTQHSEKIAVEIAQKVTGYDLSDKDVIFTIHSSSYTVDGGSAGAAMAATVIAAIEGRIIPSEIMVTGTIDEEGLVGPVSSVFAKARAAADGGARLFLIPDGQSEQIEYVKVTESPAPDISVQKIQAVKLNLTEEGKEWGLKVTEVSDINQLTSIIFQNYTGKFEIAEVEKEELPEFGFESSERSMRIVSEKMIHRAERLVAEAGSSKLAVRTSEARGLYEQGYTYSAANLAFLAAVSAKEELYDEGRLYREINKTLADVEKTLERINSGDFYYKDDLENIAAGQQRYVWAKLALADGEFQGALISSEWLEASRDIFSELKYSGEKISRKLIDETAEGIIEDAEGIVSKAVAVGADTSYAQRSLIFARESMRRGLSPAACFDSVDTIAYGAANSYSGSTAKMINISKGFDGLATTGWALGYWKHSVYLRTKASEEKSKETAVDAIVLALRSYGVEIVFENVEKPLIALPVTKTVENVPEAEAETNKTLAIISIVTFLALVLATYKLVRVQNELFALKYSKKLKRVRKRKLKLRHEKKRRA